MGAIKEYDSVYDVIVEPKKDGGTAFLLLIPKKIQNGQILMETNNCENETLSDDFLGNVMNVADKLLCISQHNPCPIFVPIIPSSEGRVPYFQQLSKECFLLDEKNENYRIDEQVVCSLNKAKQMIEERTHKKPADKVFLNGYSASGCFAQRFCLVHPELVSKCVLGGSSGSIPVPTKDLCYPIGIKDFKELTGKEFLIDEYQKIDFHYYVGELETKNKSDKRVDDFGQPAPLHDMSYMERSVPKEVGQKQREMFGTNLFERANKSVETLHQYGIKVEHKVLQGLTHRGIGSEVVAQPESVYNSQFKRERGL